MAKISRHGGPSVEPYEMVRVRVHRPGIVPGATDRKEESSPGDNSKASPRKRSSSASKPASDPPQPVPTTENPSSQMEQEDSDANSTDGPIQTTETESDEETQDESEANADDNEEDSEEETPVKQDGPAKAMSARSTSRRTKAAPRVRVVGDEFD